MATIALYLERPILKETLYKILDLENSVQDMTEMRERDYDFFRIKYADFKFQFSLQQDKTQYYVQTQISVEAYLLLMDLKG